MPGIAHAHFIEGSPCPYNVGILSLIAQGKKLGHPSHLAKATSRWDQPLGLEPGTVDPHCTGMALTLGCFQRKTQTKKIICFGDNPLPGTSRRGAGLFFCVTELRPAKYLLARQRNQPSPTERPKLLPDLGEGAWGLTTRSPTGTRDQDPRGAV